jgi:hypothetical protein
MALTSAERQRRYRERHLGFDGNKVRIELFISIHAKAQIGRLARHHGCTVTKMIEDLVEATESAIVDQLPWQQHKAYYDSHLLQPTAAPVNRSAKHHPSRRQHRHQNNHRARAESLHGNYLGGHE